MVLFAAPFGPGLTESLSLLLPGTALIFLLADSEGHLPSSFLFLMCSRSATGVSRGQPARSLKESWLNSRCLALTGCLSTDSGRPPVVGAIRMARVEWGVSDRGKVGTFGWLGAISPADGEL